MFQFRKHSRSRNLRPICDSTVKEYLPVENLNILIDSQVNGDQQKFYLEKTKMLTELLAKAHTFMDTANFLLYTIYRLPRRLFLKR